MRNLVELFDLQAVEKEYIFLYGAREFINYDLSNERLYAGKYLVAMFPVIERSIAITNEHYPHSYRADVTIWMGRKFEYNSVMVTGADLDETYRQKYDRRLFECKQELETYIKTVLCGTDLRLISLRINEAINEFDENIDFVSCDLVIDYDNAE
jgi:hypothetical protein